MKGTPRGNSDPHAQDWGRWGPTLISSLAALLGALYLLAMRQPIGSQTDVLFVDPEVDTPEKMNQRLLDLLCANETNPAMEEKLAVQRRNIAQSFQSRETTRSDALSDFDIALNTYGQLLVEKYQANTKSISLPLINLIERPFRERKAPFDPMACYFEANACFQSGAEECQSWNRITDAAVQSYQNRGNSFEPPANLEPILDFSFGTEDLQIYNTALCTLILETSYRYRRVERF